MAHRSATESGIPLNPIPYAIASQIHWQGEAVNRISVKRGCLHHYNITVRTKSLKRELRPVRVRVPLSRYKPADHRDRVNRDHDSGDAP
jgi:hypothetical protein